MELSSTDLIKNYLFSKLRVEPDVVMMQRRWGALMETVGQKKFPDFLRYYLLCEEKEIRKPMLFKHVRRRITTVDDVMTLLCQLEDHAEFYSALNDAEHEYWIEHPDAKPYIRQLSLFRISQMTPLLMVGWRKLSVDDFIRLLKLVCMIAFRYSVIGQYNPNKLESVYPLAAKSLADGSISRVGEIFRILRPLYIEDDVFISDFKLKSVNTGGSSRRLAKYILCLLEGSLSGRTCDWSTDPVSIEHILPENPSHEWSEEFSPDLHERMVFRLGNLTLLEQQLNREAGGKCFVQKEKFIVKVLISLPLTCFRIFLMNGRRKALITGRPYLPNWRQRYGVQILCNVRMPTEP